MDTQKRTIRRKRSLKGARGLTLVELMIVITLIGGLLAVISVALFKNLGRGQEGTAKIGVDGLVKHVALFRSNHEDVDCPSVAQLKEDGLSDKETKDPWGQPYVIKCDGASVIVISKGPDKQEGTPDDIRSDQDKKK